MSSENWSDLAASSPYQTAVAIAGALDAGEAAEARAGLEELIDALSRSDKRALRSHLVRLMTHILKWQTQPARRSKSWRATIRNARREIAAIQEDTPSLTRAVIESMWSDCLADAVELAEAEMDASPTVSALSWEDVFEADYELE